MSAVTEQIDFGDPRGLTDLSTFIGRARVAVPDGAIRLQVPGRGLLVVTVAVLEGSGLLGDGTVLGLRAVRVRDATPGIDATVAFASITDRVARHRGTGTTLSVPPTTVSPPWAGLTPPREGWERVGALDAADVRSAAEQGHRRGGGGDSGWSGWRCGDGPATPGLGGDDADRPADRSGARVRGARPGVPRGTESRPSSRTCGRWTRISTSRGHVLVR